MYVQGVALSTTSVGSCKLVTITVSCAAFVLRNRATKQNPKLQTGKKATLHQCKPRDLDVRPSPARTRTIAINHNLQTLSQITAAAYPQASLAAASPPKPSTPLSHKLMGVYLNCTGARRCTAWLRAVCCQWRRLAVPSSGGD